MGDGCIRSSELPRGVGEKGSRKDPSHPQLIERNTPPPSGRLLGHQGHEEDQVELACVWGVGFWAH